MSEETYEALRDSVPQAARSAWQAADKEEQRLRDLYQELKADTKYTGPYRREQA